MEMEVGGGGVEVEKGVMRVLLVDDSPVDRRVAQLLLSSDSCAGSFHVIAVDSAKKAMEFLGLKDGKQEQAIDMVLTDYCMPEMTGYDLLKAIKALNPLKPIPVIVMSSEDEPQRISRCLNAGAEDYIVKPLQSKDVQRLRNCSTARPKPNKAVPNRKLLAPLLPPSAAGAAASPSGRRASLAGVAMVLHSSSVELSHYFPLLLKLVVLVYALLCVGELLHRWSSGGGCSLSVRWCA
ncbi:unnamed protein product [Urochloa decumbens]|uniref:Response regulatory domain-containing protein n=1 Tax=Urochloa decumbens TaxID=240449 RepID=A0ABC9D6H3_9POAL